MKSRSRSCSATALAAREHAIRRSAARFRRLPGPGRSSWNGCTIAVRANTRSIAARREHRCFHTPNALRCVSKHEEVTAAHPSRRAHARPDLRQRLRTRAPQDEAAQGIPSPRLIAEPFAVIPISRCQTAHLVPAARFCARALHLHFTHPERGVGGAPRNVRVLGGTPVGRIMTRYARRLARRLASHNAGRSPLGAPPWRFWASGPRFSHRHLRRIGYSELLAPRS